MDFASRAHNHNYRLDPIVRSLLDTDFYKLLMLGFIHRHFPDTHVSFSLINRNREIRLADDIGEAELRAQLDHVRTLRFTPAELVWLRGNSFYGQHGIFEPGFIDWLSRLRLPDYRLSTGNGQFELTFEGNWAEVTLWEIHALAIVSEMRSRKAMSAMSKHELDILYAKAKTRFWDKIQELKTGLRHGAVADFGTRRRHGFLWQEWAVQTMAAELGPRFTGTSNALLAMRHGFEAVGTNAHELPMVLAALAETDTELKHSQYKVLELWEQTYGGALLVFLPDTFGTTQFLADAPQRVAEWTGVRQDSKDPVEAGHEFIDWWKARGQNPKDKLLLFSDGLDVSSMLHLDAVFGDKCRVGFGWGTLATNDFRNCHPRGLDGFEPLSLVCKIASADGRPAVKLSDNYSKATGPSAEIERYRRVFGTAGIANIPTLV